MEGARTVSAQLVLQWVLAALLGVGLIAEVASRIWMGRKKGVDAVASEADEAAGELLKMLKEQNELLRQQLDQREEDHKRERGELKAREEKLEARLGRLEESYRDLVLTVTSSRYCVNADECGDYDAGDRRSAGGKPPRSRKRAEAPAEGTD
jgi:flagellar motility protein MotE (MotC chaperone)